MTTEPNEKDSPEDSPAMDGMLRQLAREESGSDEVFVSRIIDAVESAEEEIHPPLLVIPTRVLVIAASILGVLGLVVWMAMRPSIQGVVKSEYVYIENGKSTEKRMRGKAIYAGETLRGRENATILLVDGSTITLANDTRLTLSEPEGNERIRLILLKGRCLARVYKGKGRFLIDAGVSVEVLGTTFGVRRDKEETVVAVYEGRVQVGGDTGIILTRGKSGIAEYGSRHPMDHSVSPNNELAWARPNAEFIDTPLPDVLKWISDNSSYSFTISDPTLTNKRVTLQLSNTMNLDTAVAAFLAQHQLDTNPGLTYSSSAENP